MSRAFVKESDDDLAAGELPERPLPAHANYVTPQGLEQLQARVRELQEQHERLRAAGRRGFRGEAEAARGRARPALLQRAARARRGGGLHGQPRDEVHFGAAVKIRDEDGKQHRFTIVGRRRSRRGGRQDQLGFAARARR